MKFDIDSLKRGVDLTREHLAPVVGLVYIVLDEAELFPEAVFSALEKAQEWVEANDGTYVIAKYTINTDKGEIL